MSNTIIALASGSGRAGVSIIRISGKNAPEICKTLTGIIPKPRYASLRNLYSASKDILDKALILYFAAPHSFTGEDVIEFHCHGGRAIVKSVIETCIKTGLCEMAKPGEFTRKAFDNGIMDLSSAEGLADLIDAETESQRKQALRQMQGELAKLATSWREEIILCLSESEAYIDFPDEDLPNGLSESAYKRVLRLTESLKQHLKRSNSAIRVRDGFKIAIIGPPNAGKSSLLNAIAGKEAAIVSSIAGTTRDIVEISLIIDGHLISIADTAGLRETEDLIEKEGVRRAIERAETADLRIGLIENPKDLDAVLPLLTKRDIICFSKSDLTKNKKPEIDLSKFEVLNISTISMLGIDTLESIIKSRAAIDSEDLEDAPLTRLRHRIAVEKAIESLENILNNKDLENELVCEDLRIAARSLGEIIGIVDVEDILDKIFSSFCIGK